jgi:hypothetical protein
MQKNASGLDFICPDGVGGMDPKVNKLFGGKKT